MRLTLVALLATAATTLSMQPASASPLSGAAKLNKSTSVVEKAAYRRCWWHRGHRHCRWVGYSNYYDDYPYDYGYSYGPGIGFFFGGGGHRHHGWHGGHRGHRHR